MRSVYRNNVEELHWFVSRWNTLCGSRVEEGTRVVKSLASRRFERAKRFKFPLVKGDVGKVHGSAADDHSAIVERVVWAYVNKRLGALYSMGKLHFPCCRSRQYCSPSRASGPAPATLRHCWIGNSIPMRKSSSTQ